MVSSSCSYAASAMAKSLFQKGADFVSAMVFMFASTNLVVELGIVLVVLDGLAVRGRRVHRRPDHDRAARAHRRVRAARARWSQRARGRGSSATTSRRPRSRARAHARGDRSSRAAPGGRTRPGYTIADITMLRKELVIGYARRRIPHRARADARVERGVRRGSRLLDQRRERARRTAHRVRQLRVLDRQRADGGGALAAAASASAA